MTYDPAIHHRRSIRLRGYDYAQPGWYFVTICVQDRRPLFGTVVNGRMALTDAGRMVRDVWNASVTAFSARRAVWCNQYVLHVAERVVVGRLTQDGMLACLLADMQTEKPIQVL